MGVKFSGNSALLGVVCGLCGCDVCVCGMMHVVHMCWTCCVYVGAGYVCICSVCGCRHAHVCIQYMEVECCVYVLV